MKSTLKITLVITALLYVLNNVYSFLHVLQEIPQSLAKVVNPVNVNFFNMAAGFFIGLWLFIAFYRETGTFSLIMLLFAGLCFFEPLLGTLATGLFLWLTQMEDAGRDCDVLDNIVS